MFAADATPDAAPPPVLMLLLRLMLVLPTATLLLLLLTLTVPHRQSVEARRSVYVQVGSANGAGKRTGLRRLYYSADI